MSLESGDTVIFCCGAYHEPDYIFFLVDNDYFKCRKLEILLSCPGKNNNCNAFIVELGEINKSTGKKRLVRHKNKNAQKFVEKVLSKNVCSQFKIETGSKSNMNWVYGENKVRKNKSGDIVEVVQNAVDFNNKKKRLSISIFLLITFLHSKFFGLLCSFFSKNLPKIFSGVVLCENRQSWNYFVRKFDAICS